MGNLKATQKDSIAHKKMDINSEVVDSKSGSNYYDKIGENLLTPNTISNEQGTSNEIKRENHERSSDISNSKLSIDVENPDTKKVDSKLNLLEIAYDQSKFIKLIR
jgi:hypothetical protein